MKRKALSIALISKFPPYLAGPSLHAYHLLQYFIQKGHRVVPITYQHYGSQGGRLIDLNIKQEYPFAEEIPIKKFSKLVSLPIGIMFLNALLKHHQRDPFDIIDGQYAIPHGIVSVLGGKLFGVPSVMSVKGSDVIRFAKEEGFKEIFSWSIQHASAVIACSNFVARRVRQVVGSASVPIYVVYEGVRVARFAKVTQEEKNRLRQELGFTNDDFVVGFAGRLFREKGLMYLAKAFIALCQRFSNIRLLIIGDGPLKERLQRVLDSVSRFTRIVPAQYSRYPVYLGLMDVFVLPSLTSNTFVETLGVVLLEAMAAKVPVIGSKTGGIPEVIHHRKTGLLVEQRSIKNLIEAIEMLYHDRSLRSILGEEGHKFVKTVADLSVVGRRILEIYKELISNHQKNGCHA